MKSKKKLLSSLLALLLVLSAILAVPANAKAAPEVKDGCYMFAWSDTAENGGLVKCVFSKECSVLTIKSAPKTPKMVYGKKAFDKINKGKVVAIGQSA